MSIATTPKPPYVAVIFSNERNEGDDAAYAQTADDMVSLAAKQEGYLGIESVRGEDGFGVTISYWRDEDAIVKWKKNADHITAQKAGQKSWYRAYKTRVSTVTRDYGFGSD